MTNTNNQQFKSLDSIKFVRDITPETAANYSGGAPTVGDMTSTSQECDRGINFNSNEGMDEDLLRYLYSSGGTSFLDFDTQLELTQF